MLAQKYFRKAGVPARLKPVEEPNVPEFLWRHAADEEALEELPKAERFGSEISARQVFDRLAGTWTYWGWKGKYFDTEEDAHAFYDELRFMLANRSPRPIRRNGSTPACTGPMASTARARATTTSISRPSKLVKSKSAYEHPQPHACFIQSVQDDLVNEGGIMDLWVREARLFKYGSGTGSNFSKLRGENEKLSGGGKSSGLMSFLKIGDRAAGAIKSGGTTRRAAKMVVVDVDHPDIEAYIDWKVKEEDKVAALVAGSKIVKKALKAILRACVNCEGPNGDCFDPDKNPALKREIKLARRAAVPDGAIKKIIQFARQGYKDIAFETYHDRLGFGSLSHRLRPELEQFGAHHRRLPALGRGWRRLEPDAPDRRQGAQDAEGARSVGEDRLCRLGLRRSGPAISHHDQRLAHLPGRRPDRRVEPLLRIYVPR